MARSMIPVARTRIAKFLGVSESEVSRMAESSPMRSRDWYRKMEGELSRESGMESIYAPKKKGYKPKTPEGFATAQEIRDARIERAVDRYQRFRMEAIESAPKPTSRNPKIREMQEQSIKSQFPMDIDVDYVRKHATNQRELDQLMGYMERASTGYVSGAASWDGTTNLYVQEEAKLARESFDAQALRNRREVMDARGLGEYEFEDLPRSTQEILKSQAQIMPLPKNLQGNRAIAVATNNYYLTDSQYMDTYLEALRASGADPDTVQEISSIIEKLVDVSNEGALREIMERRDNEVQISYLYRDTEKKTAFHSNFESRMDNVRTYWSKQAEKYGVEQ